ncbi:MAG TPA: hypothetical protein VIM93_10340 [Kangiella sp.]|uniref:hypothetical protein n=1 Tax=Kangiella sp. TaxID=1920245 RepID=UPI002F92A2DC
MNKEHRIEEKEIDAAIQQIASDVNLYGLDADKVKKIWFSVLLQQVADNELDNQQAH